MSDKTIPQLLTDLLVDQLGCSPEDVNFESATTISDLGADSLDSVEIVMAIEEQFSLDISDAEAEPLLDKPLGAWTQALSEKLKHPLDVPYPL